MSGDSGSTRTRELVVLVVGAGLLAVIGARLLSAPEKTEEAKRPSEDREVAGPGFLPANAPIEAPLAPPPRGGAVSIDFDVLAAFDYDAEADVIPEEVRALDGTLVELRGVMYYGVDDVDNVTDFYLMPSHMICCFGEPRANDTVQVKLKKGTKTEYVLNYYVIRGTLEVGLLRDEAGNALALYRIGNAEAEVLE